MTDNRKLAAVCGAASLALLAFQGAAVADGYEEYAPPPPPVEEGRKFTYSFNLAGVSDYVFRGISQTDNDPTVQGGIDLGYGIFYAGWWASGVDFSAANSTAETEMDWYGGIRPEWRGITFDLGALYYSYPGAGYTAGNTGPQINYLEVKGGLSGEIHKDWNAGFNIYWSPDYFGEVGSVWTFEGNTGVTLPKVAFVVPSISGVLGYQTGDSSYSAFNGFNNYWYWNAGLALAIDALTFDFRYWGTDASNATSDALTCVNNYCDGRFVFTAKIALP